MNRNYQKELDAIIEDIQREGICPRLLLHACCGPCSSYCLEYLSRYFDITVLFYNPNISTAEEYAKRENELLRLIGLMNEKANEAGNETCGLHNIKAVSLEYVPEEFEAVARGYENVPEGGARCYRCYGLRLERAAQYATEHGFDYFTTTLSISPLKNPVWINEIGEQMAEKYGVSHLPSEFRKKGGYQRSIELSREYDLYRQNYCGCSYSKREAKERDRIHKEGDIQ